MCGLLRIVLVVLFFMLSSQANAVVLKIATLSPDGSDWMIAMRQGAEEIAKNTENRVRFKFYPGGVMGDDKAVLRKIRIGQLHGGILTSGSLSKFYPDIQVYNLPLVLKSFGEVDYVRKHMDRLIIDGLGKGGFVTFGLAEGGFAYLMSTTPVKNTDDLRKNKVWIPENDALGLATFKIMGSTPIPLPLAEVRTALQTGLINTVTASAIGAIALQWYTQVNYMTDTPLMYLCGLLAIDKKAFKKIPLSDQQVVRHVMSRIYRQFDRENRQRNLEAIEALRKQGIKSVMPDNKTLEEWKDLAQKIVQNLIDSGGISQEIFNILQRNLTAYRSKQHKADE
ncbi:MAG: TRAP transporter substrate-binding protein DctP [Thermodesulfobacteriota bacterium]|nr:TRAP transporter substrate-binding protein DctP [Thermodesulfobacteriota bacterium]